MNIDELDNSTREYNFLEKAHTLLRRKSITKDNYNSLLLFYNFENFSTMLWSTEKARNNIIDLVEFVKKEFDIYINLVKNDNTLFDTFNDKIKKKLIKSGINNLLDLIHHSERTLFKTDIMVYSDISYLENMLVVSNFFLREPVFIISNYNFSSYLEESILTVVEQYRVRKDRYNQLLSTVRDYYQAIDIYKKTLNIVHNVDTCYTTEQIDLAYNSYDLVSNNLEIQEKKLFVNYKDLTKTQEPNN